MLSQVDSIYDNLNLTNHDIKYLQNTMDVALSKSLYDLYINQPDNPHQYLANYLMNFDNTNKSYGNLLEQREKTNILRKKHKENLLRIQKQKDGIIL